MRPPARSIGLGTLDVSGRHARRVRRLDSPLRRPPARSVGFSPLSLGRVRIGRGRRSRGRRAARGDPWGSSRQATPRHPRPLRLRPPARSVGFSVLSLGRVRIGWNRTAPERRNRKASRQGQQPEGRIQRRTRSRSEGVAAGAGQRAVAGRSDLADTGEVAGRRRERRSRTVEPAGRRRRRS